MAKRGVGFWMGGYGGVNAAVAGHWAMISRKIVEWRDGRDSNSSVAYVSEPLASVGRATTLRRPTRSLSSLFVAAAGAIQAPARNRRARGRGVTGFPWRMWVPQRRAPKRTPDTSGRPAPIYARS